MDILFYMLYSREIGTDGTHIFEVMNNLSDMGHSIRYANGEIYSPISIREPGLGTKDDRRGWLWKRIKRFMATTPLKGEALALLLCLKEIRLFFSALVTVLRRRPDVIYRRHTALFNSSYLIAKIFHIPSVKEVNTIFVDEWKINKRADSITLWVINLIERFNIRVVDEIIVVTTKLKELLQSEYGIEPDKIIVVQNGANTDLFKPKDMINARETLGLAQNINYVCFVGSLKRWQGLEYLIQSLPLILDRCPDTQLLIVGGGGIEEELIKLSEKTGVSNKIIFTGMVPYYKIPSYINASDVCAAFFVRERNERCGLSPLKLYEYMSCGKAVIASRVSGLEILEQQSAGILVEPENTAELATAIIRLLQNQEIRTQMGDNGRKYVVESQSWKRVAERVADVCQSLIDSRRNGDVR